jgi:hypothetical protein
MRFSSTSISFLCSKVEGEDFVGVSCVNMSSMGSKYSRMESVLIWKETSVL